MRRTVCINILAFNLLDERKYPKMHSCFSVYDKETGCQLTSQLEIHFLELKKFQSKNVKEMNRMERWAAYFSPVTPEEEIAELAAEDEDIRAAVEMEKMFTQDEVARRKYDLAEKFRLVVIPSKAHGEMSAVGFCIGSTKKEASEDRGS